MLECELFSNQRMTNDKAHGFSGLYAQYQEFCHREHYDYKKLMTLTKHFNISILPLDCFLC